MEMNRIIAVWLVIMMIVGGMLGFVNISTDAESGSRDAERRSASQSKSGLTAHNPIHIDGNDDFIIGHNGVVSGSGTASDPYIIENWEIANSGNGIWIRNTDLYFIIRNCIIHDTDSTGIEFSIVANGKIENCRIYNNYRHNLWLSSSSNNTITGNQIYNNTWYASIRLDSSSNNNITSNQIYNNDYRGISLDYSSNNNIIGNKFTNGGIVISGDILEHYVQNVDANTVNSRTLYYFLNQNNMVIDGLEIGQLILVNSTCFTIKNVEVSYTNVGIEVAFSSNNTIVSNQIYNNSQYGIHLYESSNNNITNCKVYNNSEGIRLDSSSNNNIISANQIYNNDYGVDIHKPSNSNTITSNQIYNNDWGAGIYLWYSSNNIITSNQIYNNANRGVWLDGAAMNNQIVSNEFYNNRWGICITDYSINNEVHYNNIYNNTDYGIYTECAVNATYNWWGDVDGPSGKGAEGGDEVRGDVIYSPWLIDPWSGKVLVLAVTANPKTIAINAKSKITITVTDGTNLVSGATVDLTSNQGGGFSFVTDNGDGTYTATFTAPSVSKQTVCTITAQATKTGYTSGSNYVNIKVNPATVEKHAEKEEKSFIPCFETATLIAMIGVCIILLRRRKDL